SAALWHFYLAFGVIAAIGSALLNTVPLMTIVSNWFERRRGTAMGIVATGQGAGQLALMLLQHLITRIGWRNTYLVLAATILIIPPILIGLFLYSHPSARGGSSEAERSNEGVTGDARKTEVVTLDWTWAETEWTVAKAIRTSRFWMLMLVMAMFAGGF